MKRSEQDYKQALIKASGHIKDLLAEIDLLKNKEPIAIIGMGCRFPGGADNPEAFWKLLKNGKDVIKEIPSERWDADLYYDRNFDAPGKMYTKKGGFINDIESFDSYFFGISPVELQSVDPQQRLLLETSWEALENSGILVSSLKGSKTGVFVGILNSDYAKAHLFSGNLENIDAYSVTGISFSTACGRIAYMYGLEGPNMAIDTACSSSLVAIHLACQSLVNHESNMALAGGVNLILTPEAHIGFCKMKALAPDGRCKAFDASADGLSRGEGCGMLVLKRLSDARRDNDPVLAIIKGSAVNQDGKSNGLTAPNGRAQEKVITKALENARISSQEVSYIEAHGTGTPLGDPIEMNTIGKVYGNNREKPLFVGSVKANIGHLESAAGMASIIKTVCAINNEKIPLNPHFHVPNPEIAWDDYSVAIPEELTPWTAKTKIAGISAFGFSGTNVHTIVAEAPSDEIETNEDETDITIDRPVHILPISAKSEAALGNLVSKYADYLAESSNDSSIDIRDICSTASTGRDHFSHRTYAVGSSKIEIGKKLAEIQIEPLSKNPDKKIVFMFTGQGSQYLKMGWDLYRNQPIFRQTMDKCDDLLKTHMDISLIELLYRSENKNLDETQYAQPALFSIEYALFRVWESWGIRPSALIGHSVGEYVAACVAGIFSLEDGLKLVAERSRLMNALPREGEMVSVMADEIKVSKMIEPYIREVSIAALNGPQSVVISGKKDAITEICAKLEAEKIQTRILSVSHAFHSPAMEPVLQKFGKIADSVAYSSQKIDIVSNLTGKKAIDEMASADYWVNHIRQPVRFADGIQTLFENGYEIFLETGPHPVLSGMGMVIEDYLSKIGEEVGSVGNDEDNSKTWLPSLHSSRSEFYQLFESLGELYLRGIKVNWDDFEAPFPRKKVVLPNYSFQRETYWIPPIFGKIKPDINLKSEKDDTSLAKNDSSSDTKDTKNYNEFSLDNDRKGDDRIERIMSKQIETMTEIMSKQLKVLRS